MGNMWVPALIDGFDMGTKEDETMNPVKDGVSISLLSNQFDSSANYCNNKGWRMGHSGCGKQKNNFKYVSFEILLKYPSRYQL